MKDCHSFHKVILFLLILLIISACRGQPNSLIQGNTGNGMNDPVLLPANQQVANYIRNIFQDKNGNLWMGTNGYGVAYYDGEYVSYYSNDQGFGGQQVTGIAEDRDHNIWFATNQGVVKFTWSEKNDENFTNYFQPPFLDGRQFWSILADSKGIIWAGSSDGIFRLDGEEWKEFNLPYPAEEEGNFITSKTSWSIMEDGSGNIWFSTNGYGVYIYDGKSFRQLTKEDGLTDDRVDHILEDREGNIWIGTRYGGVSKYDGKSFTNFTSRDSIGNDEVCVIFEDREGHIWMSSEGYGVYCYDGQSFRNYGTGEGLGVKAVQTIFQDKAGNIWAGGGGGLYRLKGDTFIHIGRNGPWE